MGNKLFTQVTGLTGLPEDLIGDELRSLLDKKGIAPENMTMDCLREVLCDYLEHLALEFADNPEVLEELPETTPSTTALRNKLS